ncbi:hypothetical protein AAFF_G00086890 [Aldrovandia affinis]|uniref:Carbohydrate deacetylase n=1 Tax=Aldrovandia affinis TaxID=143900 RepID=A0AAD7WDA4_9TELE|nr:hypothetical protein AAFF_G00086890 [Aldrovandia affinis]
MAAVSEDAAAQTGTVSNVSLLVNACSAKDAADLAKRHHMPIGLHANLSEGVPVCPNIRSGSTLLNEDGFFHGKTGFRKELQNGQLSMQEVEIELRAQVKLFCELTGHLPHHMDGHQHIHVLPEVREVFAQVLSDYGIPFTRVPMEPGLQACPWLPPALRDFYTQVEKDAKESVGVFRRRGIRWPDVYLGLTTMGDNMSIASIKRAISHALDAAPSGEQVRDRPVTVELMVHPGYPSEPHQGGCGQGPDDFSRSPERRHELDTLRDPRLLAFYAQQRVQLCAFRDF